MHHAHDLDTVVHGTIEDEIGAKWERPKVSPDLGTRPPDHWISAKCYERLCKPFDEPPRISWTVFSYVVANALDVRFGLGRPHS